MGTLMSIPCEFNCVSLYDIQEVNSSFAVGTLKVMYLGNNRNGSSFSKEAVEKALPSLKNVPIVCHWDDEAEEIGGHDISVVSDKNGCLRIKNLTEPCGVVPDHAQFYFHNDCDDDGNEHEYLVIKGVILWKRQDVYKYIVDELGGKIKHSMEINVLDNNESEDGYLNITNFEFTALCLLGNCEPCFQGSELELFSVQNFKQKMEQMMLEIKESFTLVNASEEVDNIHPQNYSTEGGEKVLIEDVVIKESGLETSKEESLENKIDNVDAGAVEDLENEPIQVEEPAGSVDSFALDSIIRDGLLSFFEEITLEREWGTIPRYHMEDYDVETKEVFCWDREDWKLYGFTFVMNGDAIEVDLDSKKRKKYIIVDFNEGEQQDSPFISTFEVMETKIADNSEWETKYHAASDTIMSMETELSELRQFKAEIEADIAKNEREKIFAQFNDLVGVEAFDELRENAMNYEIDVLEEKCYAIRGKIGVSSKFNFENSIPKIIVEKNSVSNDEPYGGLVLEYAKQ